MKNVLIVDDVKSWRDFNTKVIYSIFGNSTNIDCADCAQNAYNKILENNSTPYDVVITDLQMEDNYYPKYAGEWLVEQIKILPSYYKTKIIMVSASGSIKNIAKTLNIDCIPKSMALNSIATYENLLK